jgi:large subunit ribosomal protein L44
VAATPSVARGLASSSRAAASSSTASPSAGPARHLPPLARADPQLYALTAPLPLSSLSALATRFHLLPASLSAPERKARLEAVAQALVHPSLLPQLARARALSNDELQRMSGDDQAREQYLPLPEKDNAALAAEGNAWLGMLMSEALHLRFPHLPVRALKAAVSAYVGPQTLADVAAELGVTSASLLRFDPSNKVEPSSLKLSRGKAEARKVNARGASTDALRALFALVLSMNGLPALRKQLHSLILSRQLPLEQLLKFTDPKRVLSQTCAKYSLEPPVSRLIAETGRTSIAPIFVVGVWSGATKLGEGTGSALKMAEYRVSAPALH